MDQVTDQKPAGNTLPAPRPSMRSGGHVMPIVPQTMDEVWRLANAVVKARMAPKSLDTAEMCAIAIMHGMEVGLTPMVALQSIAVIGNRPTIWGDGAIALVRSSGLASYIKEYEKEDEDGVVTAYCETLRKGETEPVIRTFSVEDQITAGLDRKDIHKAYPKRMRQMRARAYCIRDAYADVLKGLSIREEVEAYAESNTPAPMPAEMASAQAPAQQEIEYKPAATMQPIKGGEADEVVVVKEEAAEVTPPPIPTGEEKPKKARKSRAKPKPEAIEPTNPTAAELVAKAEAESENPEPPEPEPAPPPPTMALDLSKPENFEKHAEAILAAVENPDQLAEVFNDKIAPRLNDFLPPEQEDIMAIYHRHEKRLGID